MELVLQQKQTLNLSMTTELRQAIELLQYSTYELEQYIREQEIENPLIELKEKEDNNLYEERSQHRSASTRTPGISMDAIQGGQRNMRDELCEQAKFIYPDEQVQSLLKYIIHNLDDNGYLSLHDYVQFDEHEIEQGIHFLQDIGPIGIGARNLRECLLLQITYASPKYELAELLVKCHLDLVAERKWDQIAARMNISMAQVKALYDFIQTLNPKPCAFISDFSTKYVTPDIIVEFKKDAFVFRLNDGYLPTIGLNNDYTHYLNTKNDMSKYINSQYKGYQWLLSSIEQRRNTIIKIVKVLLEKQEGFFKSGFPSMKPLTLKEVADEIGMHESTVSRATTNKVIQTSFGSFDLRLLFTSKLEMGTGDSVSQTKVKVLLQSLIARENKHKPYSDQIIADHFKTEKGISISRRTVNKYRKELNIPSSSQRKEIQV
ncbi:RNA polymerase factor sigma-54 [Sporosarcina sp. P17b]|uniref:RNA polymerase factor sigma-54 n=1 Tax=Sporosarcina sp. P17b TaxID=2048260 RepID=UPI000C16EA27|nr:RNA polymerase factor sigma-54 [Sporosarcina sp. P17b]PIC73372.1 RNA polymerase sigma-54 factor [Sporosarcina sp. P17b]